VRYGSLFRVPSHGEQYPTCAELHDSLRGRDGDPNKVTGDRAFEVVVVGGGPAGLAAAARAGERGARTALIDENPRPGGQIWRASVEGPTNSDSKTWQARVLRSGVQVLLGIQIVECPEPGLLIGEKDTGGVTIRYSRLILATGARELLLPFPGWTLPNVCAAGGLQSLVKSGLNIRGKRVAVAGSGPLLLAVASYLRQHGAEVVLVAEQTSVSKLASFAFKLCSSPSKVRQALTLKRELSGVPFRESCWPVEARGEGILREVEFRSARGTFSIGCDYLACGFGLVPNLELPRLLGCDVKNGFVAVDERQQTSVKGVHCAGEPTGIAGVDAAVCEGQIAGLSAAGCSDIDESLWKQREHWKRFERTLSSTFELRQELRELCDDNTVVCRCEDVAYARVRGMSSWRSAKLQTRCGMGACQGRTCGASTAFLFGWKTEHARPPAFPTRVETLIARHVSSEK
jgi:NADPH-dependent 2,4-dienoyl-CoA reductase/sulfur reductase-like enzyme